MQPLEHLDLILKATGLGLWEYDHRTDRIAWSSALSGLLGHAEGWVPDGLAGWLALIHPDDRPVAEAQVEAAPTVESPPYQAEYRMRAGHGGWIWVHVRGRVLARDDKGQPLVSAGTIADISGYKRSELLRRRNEVLLRTTLDSTADGILVVGAGSRVLGVNRRFAELWRMPDELIAAGDDEPILAYALDQLADPEGFLREVRHLYDTDDEQCDCLDFKDGRVFGRCSRPLWLEGERARLWSFRDITEERRAKLSLESERTRLETLVRTIPDPVWLKDPAGVYLACNPSFERLFGAKEADIVGRTDYDFVSRECADFFRANDRAAIESGGPRVN